MSAGVHTANCHGAGGTIGGGSYASTVAWTVPFDASTSIGPTNGFVVSRNGVRAPGRSGFTYVVPSDSAKCTWPKPKRTKPIGSPAFTYECSGTVACTCQYENSCPPACRTATAS